MCARVYHGVTRCITSMDRTDPTNLIPDLILSIDNGLLLDMHECARCTHTQVERDSGGVHDRQKEVPCVELRVIVGVTRLGDAARGGCGARAGR
jgi:hypothetical protein